VRTTLRVGECVPLPVLQHTVCGRVVGHCLLPFLLRAPLDVMVPLLEQVRNEHEPYTHRERQRQSV
jgi:hypothetical protein